MFTGIILVSLFILPFLASGMWISVAAGVVGVLLFFFFTDVGMLTMIGPLQFNIVNNFTWTPVPIFVFMGEILLRSGLSDNLYRGASRLTAPLPGGLLHTNIVSCALFAAISGSSVATAASIGTVAIPELEKRRYNRRLTLGSLAAGGTLGILIPPSIGMIIYGSFTNESVGALFLAGLLPGVLLSGLFLLYIAITTMIRPSVQPEGIKFSLKGVASSIVDIWPVVVLMFIVMGSIYMGVATPTEAAALGSLGALAFCALYRRLTWQVLKESLLNAAKLTSWVMLIVIGAQVMSMGLASVKAPAQITAFVISLPFNRLVILAFIVLMYILLGMFVEAMSMMLLTLPVVIPVMNSLGFDPIWFGVVLVVMVEMAQITPPIGINLFVINGLSGEKYLSDIMKGVIPFFFCMVVLIILLVTFPGLALWLPSTMAR